MTVLLKSDFNLSTSALYICTHAPVTFLSVFVVLHAQTVISVYFLAPNQDPASMRTMSSLPLHCALSTQRNLAFIRGANQFHFTVRRWCFGMVTPLHDVRKAGKRKARTEALQFGPSGGSWPVSAGGQALCFYHLHTAEELMCSDLSA